jgi:hypothetical protein
MGPIAPGFLIMIFTTTAIVEYFAMCSVCECPPYRTVWVLAHGCIARGKLA